MVVQLELEMDGECKLHWCDCYFRSLSGEEYPSYLRVYEEDFEEAAQATIERRWWPPSRQKLQVAIMPNHGILPRSTFWSQLLEVVGLCEIPEIPTAPRPADVGPYY